MGKKSVAQKIATCLRQEVRFFEDKKLEFLSTEKPVDQDSIGRLVKIGIIVERVPE
jgi:hypothetical protein